MSLPMPRDWGDRLVCYVCATRYVDPAKCRPANVVVNGYGVCLDDIQIIEFADPATSDKNRAIVDKRVEVDAVLGGPAGAMTARATDPPDPTG